MMELVAFVTICVTHVIMVKHVLIVNQMSTELLFQIVLVKMVIMTTE